MSKIQLDRELLERFPILNEATFKRSSFFPRIAGWCLLQKAPVEAITIRRTVYLNKTVPLWPSLLLHELGHVVQFNRVRFFFMFPYIWYSITKGYSKNPYEIEADKFAEEQLGEKSN